MIFPQFSIGKLFFFQYGFSVKVTFAFTLDSDISGNCQNSTNFTTVTKRIFSLCYCYESDMPEIRSVKVMSKVLFNALKNNVAFIKKMRWKQDQLSLRYNISNTGLPKKNETGKMTPEL